MTRKSKPPTTDAQEAALEAPAVLCNWFILTRQPNGVRLTIGERTSAEGKLAIRGAFFLHPDDGKALRDLLDTALDPYYAAPPKLDA
jgi:hypothetical protein